MGDATCLTDILISDLHLVCSDAASFFLPTQFSLRSSVSFKRADAIPAARQEGVTWGEKDALGICLACRWQRGQEGFES